MPSRMIAALCFAAAAIPAAAAADPCCESWGPSAPPPEGTTIAFGGLGRTVPLDVRSGTTGPAFPSQYTIEQGETKSLWVALGVERDNFVFATDLTFGGASVSGTTRGLDDPPFHGPTATYGWTGTLLESTLALRLGARAKLGHLAVAAGAGLGGTLYVFASGQAEAGADFSATAPTGPSGAWFVPVWAQATYKATCDWGAEVLAESDRHDWSTQTSTAIGLAMVYQPDSACKN